MNLKTVGKIAIGVGAVLILYSFITKKKVKNKNILFIGDSMTTIRDDNGNESEAWENYPNLIRKMKIAGLNVDVLAIRGKATKWMKEELPAQLKDKKYDDIFVFGGTNDIFGGLPITDTVKNIQDIVDIMIQHGARPHVIVGYDTDETWQKDKLSPTTWGLKSMDDILKVKQRYIEYQKALTDNIKKAKLIDFKLGKGMTYDGVHPNLEGNKIIAGTILDIINKGV